MNTILLHIANILVGIGVIVFNALVFWATVGLSEDSPMGVGEWLFLVLPIVLWGVLYRVQFLRTCSAWNWGWFTVSLILLCGWQFGGGIALLRALDLLTALHGFQPSLSAP